MPKSEVEPEPHFSDETKFNETLRRMLESPPEPHKPAKADKPKKPKPAK